MADPADYSDVWLECNFDGTDGDTTFQPSISYHYGGGQYAPISFLNGAHIEDDVTLFGNAVAELDGTVDVMLFGSTTEIDFLCDHSINYALEFWVYLDVLSGTQIFLSNTYSPGSGNEAGFNIGTDSSGNMIGGISDTGGTLESFAATGVFSAATWHYIKVSFDTSTGVKVRVDGTVEANESIGGSPGTQYLNSLCFGRYRLTAADNLNGRIGPIRITKGDTLDDDDVPTDLFAEPPAPEYDGWISIPGPLSPAVTYATGYVDYTALRPGNENLYVMELTGTPPYRIPISTWQASVQLDRSNYVRCVVPAADDHKDVIEARQPDEEFVIYGALMVDGVEVKSELLRSAMDLVTFDNRPSGHTCALSSYSDASVAALTPKTITLTGVQSRSMSATGKLRFRCALDWYLRAGDTAVIGSDEITVTYITYYCSEAGTYMEVGER